MSEKGSSKTVNGIDISVVIPLLDEARSLQELYERVTLTLSSLERSFELLFVDDGSVDGSFAVLERLHQQDQRVKVIQFRKNFGKAAALSAAFKEVKGDLVVTMDADLQDVPEEIPRLLATLEEGYDLVSGWKTKRRDPLSRRLASRIFNLVVAVLTGIRLHDFNSGFKCYRREVTRELKLYGELHRYIPVLACWRGFCVAEVEVQHQARRYGRSKYSGARIFRGFFDLLTVMTLTRYSQRPLHLFGLLGLSLITIGLAIDLYLTGMWFYGRWLGNRPLLLLGVLLLIIGIQLVFFGLLAELIGYTTQNGEAYTTRRRLGDP